MEKVAILIVVESGYIEHQAILLIDSILKYANLKKINIEIFTFSPRKDYQPNKNTKDYLKNNVTHHFYRSRRVLTNSRFTR